MQNHNITLAVDELEINMNLEEAKANIGKEVLHIKTNENYIIDSIGSRSLVFVKKKSREQTYYVDPHLLKLKEQSMQNYKIQVTPETSEEVQKLFFELGYEWNSCGKKIKQYDNNFSNLFIIDGYIYKYTTTDILLEGITLPQLHDLVVLKRNDVGDATHEHIRSGNKYYRGFEDYCFSGIEWVLTDITFPNSLKPINKEMTWQDALRYLENGEDVEFYNQTTKVWHNLIDSTIRSMRASNGKFRLKPKTIHIDGGEYTKEELLKIAGEME